MRRAALFAALALCMATASAAGPALKTLRKGNGPDVETLDPHKARSVSAANVLRDLFEGLVTEAADGSPAPGMAERWEVSGDGLEYRFQLRAEARWSNGDPLVADDFRRSLGRALDPLVASPSAQMLSPIAAVEAPDARTLVIRLKSSTPYFLGVLAQPVAYPVHASTNVFTRPDALVCNGAYRLREWTLQSRLLLERNPRYWNDAATRIDRVVYLTTEDINAEYQRFRAGELDWTEQVPANLARSLAPALQRQLQVADYLGLYYYGLNLTQLPFRDNPGLRRALSLALDREVIADKLLGTGERAAYAWVPPGIAGYAPSPPEWAGWPRQRRLEQAQRLYAEAGYFKQNPLHIEILYNTHDQHRKIATVVAAMWKQFLGVETTLVNEEAKVFLQTRRARRTQVFRASWIGDYADPLSFLELLYSRNGRNDSGYASERYDRLLDEAAAIADPAQRFERLRAAEALMLDDVPVIPIYSYVSKRLVSPRVVGWQANVLDHHYTRSMDLVDVASPARGRGER